ncbi:hypothetical protein M0805_003200 [Coniferiporia weirii]|nr:hypothetical protein M0805_003200 [Coniferiporia weirii]
MKTLNLATSTLVFAIVFNQAISSPQIVDLGYSTYQATLNTTSNVTSFLGIRYASPPTGQLRFQAPAPPLIIEGIQLADTQPPECPQAPMGIASTSPFQLYKRATDIEDCLFLNVFVQGEVSPDLGLPVVVWIHGGGYVFGGAAQYDGGDLIKDANGGVVVVEIQYRLGLFGFLPGSKMKKHGALNAGLLDQEFALKWVQQHISNFGGDPKKVTIWGESAGAGSVLQHIVAHSGNTQPSLFRAGMTSSTYLPPQYNYDDAIPEQLYSKVVQQVGCSNSSDTFSCLVTADASSLETVNFNICLNDFFGTFAFVPVVDGSFIVERPMQTISRGILNGDTLLSVTNTFEGRTFVDSDITSNMSLSDYISQLFPTFKEAQLQAAVLQYTGTGLDTVVDQAIAVMGESIFICPTYALLNAFGGRSFKGEFAVQPGEHGYDVAYYFPDSFTQSVPNAQVAASFAGSFLSVVKSLSPDFNPLFSESVTPVWPTYSAGDAEMLFNVTESGEAQVQIFSTDNALLERCKFWASVAEFTPQ